MKWRDCLIGDFMSDGSAEVQTGPFGTQLKASDYVSDGTPVINVRNVGYADLRAEKLEYVADHTADRLRVHRLKENDIVFGRKGAVDRHLFVVKDQENWMQGSDCIRLRFSGTQVYPQFVSYAFLQKGHQQWMLTQSGNKATMASLNQDIIARIPLRLPMRPVQEAIVGILSAYDELMENNRRRMGLLEKAAHLLYEEWFVRLRFPGHEHTPITNGIPQGWERKKLIELCESVDYGYTASADREAIGPKFLRITDIVPEFIDWASVPYCPIEDDRLAKFRLVEGDIVVARTGATVGYAKRIHKRHPETVFASYLVRLRPKADVENLLLGVFVESQAYKDYVKSRVGGAAQPNANAQVLAAAELLVPSATIQREFRDFVEPLVNQREVLQHQNQKLRAARDLLLPRLMSGEIAV